MTTQLYPKAAVVLTLGGDGSCYCEGSTQYRQDIYPVDVVDTTAAGDTFTGYFIAAMLEGKPVDECLRLASKASSIAVGRKGAAPSIPQRSEVIV